MKATDEGTLNEFLGQLRNLTVQNSPSLGPSLKKPLMLLCVLSRVARGDQKENRIYLSDIEAESAQLITDFGGRQTKSGPAPEMAFFHLRSAPFWSLTIEEGPANKKGIPPKSRLRSRKTFASLPADVFRILKDDLEARRRAGSELLHKWWAGESREALRRALGL